MKFTDFADAIKAEYSKNFKDCCCKVRLFQCLGSSIYIDCYLARNEHEVSHGYFDNDMIKAGFVIHLDGSYSENDELPETLVMESMSKHYLLKPADRCSCFGRGNVQYRKTSGDAKKLVKSFGKFADRLYNAMIEDYRNGNTCEKYNPLIERLL